MKVTIEQAQGGYGYIAKPQSAKTNKQIEAYLQSYNEEWDGRFFQSLEEIECSLEGLVTPRNLKRITTELSYGWPVTVNLDEWSFLQGWVGYDAGDRNLVPLP